MDVVGTVLELWRYPVKSMIGESLRAADVGPLGVAGDRGWALRDERAGEIRGAKKLPELLRCRARYRHEPSVDDVPPVDIVLPDGARTASDDPEVAARLSHVVGRPVTLWPRRPADDLEHYRRGAPDNPDFEQELRQIFGREPDEPLPDLTAIPPEIFEFTSPRGTYFDVFPMHVLTTASLSALMGGDSPERFDRRRFRPNVLVETTPAFGGLVEAGWSGRRLRLGTVELDVRMPTARCVMVTLPQGDLGKDPGVLRAVVREAAQSLGAYATIVTAGRVAVGDPVALV
jgi:uncharacterized protein YcbX